MPKTILITGSTDGIGLATAKNLAVQGHHILLHGRSAEKLAQAKETLTALANEDQITSYQADLSNLSDVAAFAKDIAENHSQLDVLINNAGVYKTPNTTTKDGLDIRFAVNTLAPYLLTKHLLPTLGSKGRVINLSSAAQSTVDPAALKGETQLSDSDAYSQSKLALTMWSRIMGEAQKENGPVIIAVNPGSFLASKMVKEAYGMQGNDLNVGADILIRAALNNEFADASGRYFDNDQGQFADPHPDALDLSKSQKVTEAIEFMLTKLV